MSEPILSTLSVSFAEDAGLGNQAGQNKIILEQLSNQFDFEGNLYARCFPSRGVIFTTSAGSVFPEETRSELVFEGLKFSNSSKASLKYPGATSVVIDSSRTVLMRKTKNNYGKTIIVPATDVTLRYDAEQSAVIAESSGYDLDRDLSYQKREVAVYGACSINYSVLYTSLRYVPDGTRTRFADGSNAWVVTVGSIFAYNEYDVETLDLEVDSSQAETEFAKLYRKIILTPEGIYEKPLTWPDESEYINGHYVDPSNAFVDEKVIARAIVNSGRSVRYENFGGVLDLYDEISPPYYWSISRPSNTFWQRIFLSVNVHQVELSFELTAPGSGLILETHETRPAK